MRNVAYGSLTQRVPLAAGCLCGEAAFFFGVFFMCTVREDMFMRMNKGAGGPPGGPPAGAGGPPGTQEAAPVPPPVAPPAPLKYAGPPEPPGSPAIRY